MSVIYVIELLPLQSTLDRKVVSSKAYLLVIGDGNYFVLQQDLELTTVEGECYNAAYDNMIDDYVVVHSDETEDQEDDDDDDNDVI